MSPPRAAAATVAGTVLLLNLIVEYLLLKHGPAEVVLIPGLLDFHQAWNRGVSFSLLWQSSDTGRIVLSLGLVVIVLVMAVMAWRAREMLSAVGYGLIIGGALGNLYDRIAYRAVFDFLFLHLARQPLFVCNLADIAITLGALCLIGEALRPASSRNSF